MMDLTKKALPNTVCVNGKAFSIYTDFRLWMRFEIEVSKMRKGDVLDIRYLFKNEYPDRCDARELFAFSRPVNELPRSTGGESNAIVLDYEIDSDYIYAAFLGQYGIDLCDVDELHWHKFLALLRGLTDNTKLYQIMGYRCYEKDNRKDVDHMAELKAAWEITRPLSEEEQEALDKFNKMFGG